MGFVTFPPEQNDTKLIFALRLRDRLTLLDALAGDVSVTAGAATGWRKGGSGTFLFFSLPNGPTTFAVRSGPDTPFYLPTDINVTLPAGTALWPAFPDITLANPTLPLSDPGQPAAYRTQFLQCALQPAIAYPFDNGATLLRGMVLQAGVAVSGASVFDVPGNALPYTTGADGQFVLVWTNPPAAPVATTIRTQRAGHPDVDTTVTIQRGVTTAVTINV
jgi:hypothetical protein